jgi:hypothetical protein
MTVQKTAKKKAAPKAKKAANGAAGYKDHRADSNKGKAHEMFDKAGGAKADPEIIAKLIPKVEALGIKASTARSWFGTWRRS